MVKFIFFNILFQGEQKMSRYCPPYINKHTEQLKKQLTKAEKKEAKAKKDYETAQEYTKLCREAYEKAQD